MKTFTFVVKNSDWEITTMFVGEGKTIEKAFESGLKKHMKVFAAEMELSASDVKSFTNRHHLETIVVLKGACEIAEG